MNVDIRFVFCTDNLGERQADISSQIVAVEGQVPDEKELKIIKENEKDYYKLKFFNGRYEDWIGIGKDRTHSSGGHLTNDSVEFEELLKKSSFEKSLRKDCKYVDIGKSGIFDVRIYNKIVRII